MQLGDSVSVQIGKRGSTRIVTPANRYSSPPPEARLEDEGLILLDVNKMSFLLVRDASSFEELARAVVSLPIPFSLHGQYFESAEGGALRRHLH